MTYIEFDTWFMALFAFGSGVMQIRTMRREAADPLRCAALTEAPAPLSGRVKAVVAERSCADEIPPALPYVAGGIWIALSVLIALRFVAPTLGYGLGCLGLAATLAYAFMRPRPANGRRAAVLVPRHAGQPIPPPWYAAAVVAALATVPFALVASQTAPALLVALSTLVTIALAVAVSGSPAALVGADLPVEQLVDERIRFVRASTLLSLAFVQPFIFCGFAAIDGPPIAIVAVGYTLLAAVGYSIWYCIRRRAPMRTGDLKPIGAAK